MDLLVFLLVLAAAVMHALWNAVVKVAGDRLFSMAVMMATHSVVALPCVFYLGLPSHEAWFWILLSASIHLVYYFAVINQYRLGDLSHVYPLSRGMAPLLVFAMAYLFAGELLTGLGAMAAIVISLGILALALPHGPRDVMFGKATLAAMGTSVLIACYTVADGIGGRTDGEVVRYIAWLFLIEGIPLSTGACAVVIWAMSMTPMTSVSALRETSVIFAALIGTYRMREPMGPRRIAASIVVAIGIVLLQAAERP